jgi:hypothetical protein
MRAKCLGFALIALTGLSFAQTPGTAGATAESLYLRLQSVGLDAGKVYKIRDVNLDRGAVHLSLDDGTIAFTQEAGGHITGALFEGDGELLLVPPNAGERASMAFFTGAAILEERFSVAYFRFNDDLFSELKGSLRPADEPADFAARFNGAAVALDPVDALRLLVSFSNSPEYAASSSAGDHLLHAYIQGSRLGAFEVRYDSLLPEPISVGQHKTNAGTNYYDVWASFTEKNAKPAETDPDTGLLSTRDFDITQFKIRSEVTPPTEISATATLSLAPRRNGSRVLLFELSRLLQVHSIEVNGQPVQSIHNQAIEGSQLAKRGNDALAVFLPDVIQIGHPLELKISYSGAVLSEAANGLLYVGEHGTWYPNIGFSMSSFDLEFQYPAGWTLVSVGKRTELKTEGNIQTSHWVTERKVPVVGFNLGRYSRTVARAAGVSVETYATANVEKGFARADTPDLPTPDVFRNPRLVPATPSVQRRPSPAENLRLVNISAAEALEFYSDHFGSYPYSSLMLTQFPGTVSQGWPGLVFLSSYAFLSPAERERIQPDPTDRVATELVIAHETAHQWWGDLVTWTGYRDQWMMEALANYSAMMLLESRNPAAFRKLMDRYRDNLFAKGKDDAVLMDAGPVTLGLRLSSSKFPGAYEAISYGRGTRMFHMLRTMLRDGQQGSGDDEPFVRALREMRKEYEGRSITTAQMLSFFEAQLPKPLWYEGKKSLDWFYESWLNGTAVPRFELRNVKITNKEGPALVTGTIVQEHAPESLVTAVPLYAVVGGKQVFVRHIFAEGKETPFRISAPPGVRKILLDPQETLLSRAK